MKETKRTEFTMVLWSHLPFTVGFHQFAEWSVSLDFKLHHRAILPRHLQVDVLIVLSLHSLLQRGREREKKSWKGCFET